MKLFKTKQGFTLIELLVVIGILAVLTAIAIPSVAGLIDRANVSADATNANEMTNAVERFVSEYELYCQDLASNQVKLNSLDAAQGRVYNVTGADDRADIELLESTGLNGKQINIDTKYPTNVATMHAVVENYMKTSSTTFTPKQSDMTYWYNTLTGYTVVAEKYSNTETLYQKLPYKVDYINKIPASTCEWIDLSSNVSIPNIRIVSAETGISENSGVDVIKILITCPHPEENPDINYEKLYYMVNRAGDGLLSKENNRGCVALDKDIFNYTSNENGNASFIVPISYEDTSLKDTPFQFRLCFEYTEDGITRYAYSSVVSSTFNTLLNQGK